MMASFYARTLEPVVIKIAVTYMINFSTRIMLD